MAKNTDILAILSENATLLSEKHPGYLKDCFLPYEPTQQLRYSQKTLLKEPYLSEVREMACKWRAFSVAAPSLWNALPNDI